MVTEKRAYRRLGLDGNVRVKAAGQSPRVVKAYLDDISLGGFQVYALEKVDIGEKVGFELMTPLYREALLGEGKVRHIRPVTKYNTDFYSMGVEFGKVKKQEVMRLIKIRFGRRNKPGFFGTHKKELALFFLFLPLMIALCWYSNDALTRADYSAAQEKASADKFNDAITYYLYHSH